MNAGFSLEYCHCNCHTNESVKHIIACCHACETCGALVRNFYIDEHKKKHAEEKAKLAEDLRETQLKKIYHLIEKNSGHAANCKYWATNGIEKAIKSRGVLFGVVKSVDEVEIRDLKDRLFQTNAVAEELWTAFEEMVGWEKLDKWDEEKERDLDFQYIMDMEDREMEERLDKWDEEKNNG